MKRALYPGSFDPVTNGHMEIIRRAATLFDEVIVLVSVNPSKNYRFTVSGREALLRTACIDIPNVKIDSHSGLIVDYFAKNDCDVIVKGLRALTDFETEFQMAHINRNLCPKAETIFLCANSDTTYLSSSMVKEIAKFGGDISKYIPYSIVETVTCILRSKDAKY